MVTLVVHVPSFVLAAVVMGVVSCLIAAFFSLVGLTIAAAAVLTVWRVVMEGGALATVVAVSKGARAVFKRELAETEGEGEVLTLAAVTLSDGILLSTASLLALLRGGCSLCFKSEFGICSG